MYKNKADGGQNNVCGRMVRQVRKSLPGRVSQRALADMLQCEGLDLDKNAIQRIESGERFVTDIELRIISRVLKISYEELLGDSIGEMTHV